MLCIRSGVFVCIQFARAGSVSALFVGEHVPKEWSSLNCDFIADVLYVYMCVCGALCAERAWQRS
jgi:hypothetical protein